MPSHSSPDLRAEMLSAVLDVLRKQGHVVQVIALRPDDTIELKLDPEAPAQQANELDDWRAARRRRARAKADVPQAKAKT